MQRLCLIHLSCVLIVSLIQVSEAVAMPLYRVTDLGTASTFGQTSWAVAVNNNGQVLGSSNGVPKLYSNGQMTNIGSLGGHQSVANGLNDNGLVVGYSDLPGNSKYHAFKWQNGVMTDLGVLSGNYSMAEAVNNNSQIVGVTNAPGVNQAAFLIANGAMNSIGSLGGTYSWARGISGNGKITGLSTVAGNDPAFPFLYVNGVMTNLGVVTGFDEGTGNDVNDNGQVVGYIQRSDSNVSSSAFFYSNGQMTALGTFGGLHSEALAINVLGDAVGYAEDRNGKRAFLYHDGVVANLNTLLDSSGANWLLQEAADINDQGWIVGYGSITGGGKHAFLLTPVPEPSTLALAALGALGLLIAARRRR